MSSQRRPAPRGGDINHLTDKRTNSIRMDGEIMKKKLRRTCSNPDGTNGTMKSLKHPPKNPPKSSL
jgi:hypothetical protein